MVPPVIMNALHGKETEQNRMVDYGPYQKVLSTLAVGDSFVSGGANGTGGGGGGWWGNLCNAYSWIYSTVVLRGLARLYLHGPTVAGVGGWHGHTPASICSQMTDSSEDFWKRSPENMAECHRLIAQQFYSWIVLAETVVYFIVVFRAAQWGISTLLKGSSSLCRAAYSAVGTSLSALCTGTIFVAHDPKKTTMTETKQQTTEHPPAARTFETSPSLEQHFQIQKKCPECSATF